MITRKFFTVGRKNGRCAYHPLFVLLTCIAICVASTGCKKPTHLEIRNNLYDDFLNNTDKTIVSRDTIRFLLYDIAFKGKTSGRALHIGDGYFLTAFHVVDGRIDQIKLIPQLKRHKPKGNSSFFEILHHDTETDLAILRAVSNLQPEGRALIALTPQKAKPLAEVSKFLGLVGDPFRKDFEQDYYGVDFYREKDDKDLHLGKMILPAHSSLYEIRGFQLPYKKDYFDIAFGQYKYNKTSRRLTTILTYDGDSGSPVFERMGPDQFRLTGVITHSYATGNTFKTPGHPLGYSGMEQAGGIFSHRTAIEKLFREAQLIPENI